LVKPHSRQLAYVDLDVVAVGRTTNFL